MTKPKMNLLPDFANINPNLKDVHKQGQKAYLNALGGAKKKHYFDQCILLWK